jgi:hypothetical protein
MDLDIALAFLFPQGGGLEKLHPCLEANGWVEVLLLSSLFFGNLRASRSLQPVSECQ